VTLSSCISCLV